MAKGIAYLILVVFAAFLLHSTGLLDGIFDRGNLEARTEFWEQTVAREAPAGTSKIMVDSLAAREGMTLECFHTSLAPPVANCIADDPASKGGTATHPVALQLSFVFNNEKLVKFETSKHVVK